ncbi:hypothetical protein [Vibrio gangliei]|nr:hypothetical protein [Vibrio gangliei]
MIQTGIAPKTLLLANIHWRNWESHTIETEATKPMYGGPFVTFANNTFDYGLGLSYQFTPKFVMFTEGVYGESVGEDGIVNPFAPGNGTTTFKLGGSYDIGDFSLFMVGSYIWLKDGVSKPVDNPYVPNASFEDNTVFALSTGFEYKF